MTEFVELDAMKSVGTALETLSVEERIRVLIWANAKYSDGANVSSSNSKGGPGGDEGGGMKKPASKSKSKSGKKSKSVLKADKNLDLFPKDKSTAEDFCDIKKPTNVRQKCVVAVYYLRDIIELEKISTDHVYTFFKTVGWPVPSDLKNTLQQAGTETWLDTADGSDIKLTTNGENLVEHQLPASTPNKK